LAFALTIRLAFAMLFGGALAHKLIAWPAFEATLRRYLKGFDHLSLVRPVAVLVVVAEACALALCASSSSGPLTAGVAGGVLLIYGGAMLINLMRGNALLDCGCSWGQARQPVSYVLVARNLGLALLALLLVLPVEARPLAPIEVVSVVMAALTGALLHSALNGLLKNSNSMAGEAR
jgi:hypothetical protein